MYVHKDAKVAYLAHPRTASTATAKALREQAGFTSSHQHHYPPYKCLKKWPEHYNVDFKDDWLVFSTIRNHYKVFRSWHAATNYGQELTPDVLELVTERNMYFDTKHPPPFWRVFYHVPFCTDLVRYENLQEEVNEILTRRGLGAVEIPEVNVSRDVEPYEKLFDYETKKWVHDHFCIEMKRYNYAF